MRAADYREAVETARRLHAEYEALRKEADVAEKLYRDARQKAAEIGEELLLESGGDLPPSTGGYFSTHIIQAFDTPRIRANTEATTTVIGSDKFIRRD